jgi:uncharacterized cupredoxin-like copper-binding protein
LRKLWVLALACVLTVAYAGCGGDGEEKTSAGVSLKEWSVTVSAAEATAGAVTFQVRNEGSMPHQFIVIKNDLPPEMLPVANGAVAISQVNVLASIEPIAAGATTELRFDATPGKYVLVCNVPGHYQQGMAASFLVEP